SGSSGGNTVEVQVLSTAPYGKQQVRKLADEANYEPFYFFWNVESSSIFHYNHIVIMNLIFIMTFDDS
ncbi:hypothetical protein, partial [Brevibacillus sp. FIR094]|uniref:hypothetical protein n=1 Tax=Brevibacillus sp. FIR094 TaxID=3134809 RepID=UPI003D250CF9